MPLLKHKAPTLSVSIHLVSLKKCLHGTIVITDGILTMSVWVYKLETFWEGGTSRGNIERDNIKIALQRA